MVERFDKYRLSGAYHWLECDPGAPGWSYNPPLVARYQFILDIVTRGKQKVLDIGGGDGYLARELNVRGAEVTIVESDSAGINLAFDRLSGNDGILFVQGDAYQLPFPDETFDFVVMADVIEHLDRPHNAVSEAARVCRRSGQFVLSTPQWRPDRCYDPRHVKEYKPDELYDLLGGAFPGVSLSYGIPKLWLDFYSTRFGWRALKYAGKRGLNPFLKRSNTPAGFCHIVAVCSASLYRAGHRLTMPR